MGLPDALQMNFSLLSTGSTGLPSDEAPSGTCGGVDWQVSTAIVDLLTSVVFDYAGAVGNCCWSYHARKDYTFDAGDDNTCGSPFTSPAVLFGDAPFTADYRDGSYLRYEMTENVHFTAPGVYEACTPEDPQVHCCGDCPSVGVVAGTHYEWFDATRISYSPVIGDGLLWICLSDSTVTISGSIQMYLGIIQKVGLYESENAGETGGTLPCSSNSGTNTDETTVSCTGGASPVAEFPFAMSADLSGVSGATWWEKIKNCTTWQFDYAYGVCGGPPGCAASGETCIGRGEILASNCFPGFQCENGDGVPTTTATDDPVDQICLYSYGTLGVDFADA